MFRPHPLIAALVIAAAPASALAQAWPTTVVAAAPRMTTAARVPALNLQREADLHRATPHRGLKIDRALESNEAPKVELRAKAAWSDDQGLRVGLNRVAYKSRF